MSVIYEKHYPHPSFEEEMKELEKYKQEMESSPDYEPEPMLSFEEFYNNMMKNRTLILLPRKMKRAKDFIKLAINASKIYEIDIKITKNDSHIAVDYSFDCAGDMFFLIPILRLADSISFFTGRNGFEITISIDYYTYAVMYKNQLLHPQNFQEFP